MPLESIGRDTVARTIPTLREDRQADSDEVEQTHCNASMKETRARFLRFTQVGRGIRRFGTRDVLAKAKRSVFNLSVVPGGT